MWTKDEIDFLIKNYQTNSNTDLALKLNKSVGSFNAQVSKLGLKKDADYIKLLNRNRVLDKLKEAILLKKLRQVCDRYTNYSIFLKEQKKTYNKLYYLGLLDDYTSHMKVEETKESLKYLIESKNYYKVGDIVLIKYWYNDMICPVRIIDISKRTYTVSHNIKESKIFKAPDEKLKTSQIIDVYRTDNSRNTN